jgi:WD40 repeat protein
MKSWPFLTSEAVGSFGKIEALGFSDGHIEVTLSLLNPPNTTSLYWHRLPVLGLAFARTTPLLASSSADKSIVFWQPRSGKWRRIREIGVPAEATSLSFCEAANSIAVSLSNGEIRFFDLADTFEYSEKVINVQGGSLQIAFRPDSEDLLAGTDTGKLVLLVGNVVNEERQLEIGGIRAIAVRKDGFIGIVGDEGVVILDSALKQDSERLELSPGLEGIACHWDSGTAALSIFTKSGENARWIKRPGGNWIPFTK